MGYTHVNAKGNTYYLNTKAVTLKGGRVSNIYYFSKDERPEHCDLPEGKTVVENPLTGFLALKNKV